MGPCDAPEACALIALAVTALWRAKLRIGYETWHLTHIVLAVVAVTGGLLHMVGWGFYLTDPWKRPLWIGLTIFWIGLLPRGGRDNGSSSAIGPHGPRSAPVPGPAPAARCV